MANESITKLAEYQAMCDILAPVFRDYLKAHGTAVDEIEVATSLEGITTLPGRYSLGGVDKNVLVPLDLLTLDVRQRIDECRKATADANIAAASATTAADAANRAADRVDESVLDLTVEKAAVLKACADAEEAATRAVNAATEATLAAEETTAATEDARTLMMQFTAAEDARRDAEQERVLAELQRKAFFESARGEFDNRPTFDDITLATEADIEEMIKEWDSLEEKTETQDGEPGEENV